MNTKNDKAFKVFHLKTDKSLSIYIDSKNSKVYQARIYIPKQRRYITRSTRTNDVRLAEEKAFSIYQELLNNHEIRAKAPNKETFDYWCKKFLTYRKTHREMKHSNFLNLQSKINKLSEVIGDRNIKDIRNDDLELFFKANKDQSNNTKNKYISLATSVFKFAHTERAIDFIPAFRSFTTKSRDNPRPAFSFDKKNDEYQKLLDAILEHRDRGSVVMGHQITNELYFVVMFLTHGFMRPTTSELFAIKHKDIKKSEEDVDSLEIRIKNGKTGYRITNSTSFLVDIYKRLKEMHGDTKLDDYIFMPNNFNRDTVKRIFQEQFRFVVQSAELFFDENNQKRTLYSLRHTAIQMRLVLSGGKINLLALAQNCGTSVEMIERYYAKYLPRSKEIIQNLQSFV